MDFAFTVAIGRVRSYCLLPEASDAVVAVLLKAAGLQVDATLADHDNLASLLAAANDEADFASYARQTVTGLTVVEVEASDECRIDCDDSVWLLATTGQSLGKLLFCYDPDTTAGTDATIIPLVAFDFVFTTDGNDLTAQVDPLGFFAAEQVNPL